MAARLRAPWRVLSSSQFVRGKSWRRPAGPGVNRSWLETLETETSRRRRVDQSLRAGAPQGHLAARRARPDQAAGRADRAQARARPRAAGQRRAVRSGDGGHQPAAAGASRCDGAGARRPGAGAAASTDGKTTTIVEAQRQKLLYEVGLTAIKFAEARGAVLPQPSPPLSANAAGRPRTQL